MEDWERRLAAFHDTTDGWITCREPLLRAALTSHIAATLRHTSEEEVTKKKALTIL